MQHENTFWFGNIIALLTTYGIMSYSKHETETPHDETDDDLADGISDQRLGRYVQADGLADCRIDPPFH
jgi:hypothetical protein